MSGPLDGEAFFPSDNDDAQPMNEICEPAVSGSSTGSLTDLPCARPPCAAGSAERGGTAKRRLASDRSVSAG